MRSYREFATVYDRLMEEMPYAEWMSFARRCWERYGMPRTVVDLGCGTGNIAIPLAKSGFAVFGVDLSADMLSVARSKWESTPRHGTIRARDEDGSIRWLQQDMRDWELPEPADAVISFCDSLNYLTEPEDVVATFHRTYAGLAAGGLFLFDVHAPAQLARYGEEQPFVLDDRDVAYLWTCDYDPARQEVEHDLTFFVREEGAAGGGQPLYRRFEESHVQRAYEPDWLARQLRAAGFELLHRCADFGLDEPDDASERLFFVARKPA
ncbi:class I SAM-dependent methyltransferase [Cohnella sp. REN36]|uniref:class I SAM-dependent DNA methyltransferase n=1 Tax=Cohnella sp. REN36 TaxID=2887347 RepID=UPI001D144FB9|nr:class I SAM-dependent methyltransferase [Cohnella sp. REN36]MCC3375650.1 class I SAM-dependent methyltransferase [Cohnella sp. REN36]